MKAEYERENRKVFGETVRMISSDKMSTNQQTMLSRIENEFGNDRDGYELIRYLTLWANSLTNAEVKVLKLKLERIFFLVTQSPLIWEATAQEMQQAWLRIPEAKRGGGEPELCEMLLDKMPDACDTYVQFVRAFMAANGQVMDDYQGVAKMLVDLHTERCATRMLKGSLKPAAQGHLASTTDDLNIQESAEAQITQGGKPGKSGNKPSKLTCHRCGKPGHIKKDCTATCPTCGLQRCGGVKNKDRCMTKNGIPPGLAKIISPEIKAEIVAKAKAMGFHSKWVNGAAAHLSIATDEPMTIQSFFDDEEAPEMLFMMVDGWRLDIGEGYSSVGEDSGSDGDIPALVYGSTGEFNEEDEAGRRDAAMARVKDYSKDALFVSTLIETVPVLELPPAMQTVTMMSTSGAEIGQEIGSDGNPHVPVNKYTYGTEAIEYMVQDVTAIATYIIEAMMRNGTDAIVESISGTTIILRTRRLGSRDEWGKHNFIIEVNSEAMPPSKGMQELVSEEMVETVEDKMCMHYGSPEYEEVQALCSDGRWMDSNTWYEQNKEEGEENYEPHITYPQYQADEEVIKFTSRRVMPYRSRRHLRAALEGVTQVPSATLTSHVTDLRIQRGQGVLERSTEDVIASLEALKASASLEQGAGGELDVLEVKKLMAEYNTALSKYLTAMVECGDAARGLRTMGTMVLETGT